MINKSYKTELDPTNMQRSSFIRHCGAVRFVYNWALNDRIERYKVGEPTNRFEQVKRFNALKYEQFPWLQEGIAYKVIEYAFASLDRAYQNFFRRVKQGQKSGFPKFKSRKHGLGSFTVDGSIKVESSRIRLPVIGWVRLKENNYVPIDADVRYVTVSGKAGRWFVSVSVKEEIPDPIPFKGKIIGIDVGIKSLAVCSDGKVFENPKALRSHERKLKHIQRELCRRKKGSRNRAKTKQKLARLHYKIACIRNHALHQVSDYLVTKTKAKIIVLEDLNVKGMVKNHSLAKHISDASFSELRRQIEYKAAWNGIKIIKADIFFPSSRRCSQCGAIKEDLSLAERIYHCDVCGYEIDRDLNAAINLKQYGRKIYDRCLRTREVTSRSIAGALG